jgi:hypothetical protein
MSTTHCMRARTCGSRPAGARSAAPRGIRGLGPQRRRKSTGPCRPSPGYHTFAAPTDIRIDLYCSTRTWQRSAEAFMSAVDARHMHEQVCPSTGSSPSGNIAPSAATQVANAPLPVTIPIMIEDAPCTGSCEGALTIDCVTWQPGCRKPTNCRACLRLQRCLPGARLSALGRMTASSRIRRWDSNAPCRLIDHGDCPSPGGAGPRLIRS